MASATDRGRLDMSQLRDEIGYGMGHTEEYSVPSIAQPLPHTYPLYLTHAQCVETLRAYRIAAEQLRGQASSRMVDRYNELAAVVYGPSPVTRLIRDADGNVFYNDGSQLA